MINNTIKSLFHSSKTAQSSNQFHNRCVCEICKCGKHHCPIHTDNMHGDFQSTFQHDYQPWKSNKQRPFNYDRQPQQHTYDPSTLMSQYQSEYIQRPLPERQSRQLPELPPSQPFTSLSDYQTNYYIQISKFCDILFRKDIYLSLNQFKIKIQNLLKINQKQQYIFDNIITVEVYKLLNRFPLPMKRSLIKQPYKSAPRQVHWHTTYGVDFIQKPVGGSEQFKPSVKDGPNVNVDFGSTTYKTSYVPKPISKQERCRDPVQRNINGDPGQIGNSTYKLDYTEKQSDDNYCPILALPRRPNQLRGGNSHLNYDAVKNRWV